MWVKLHDGMPDDPDVDSLSDAAFRLYVAGLCYAAREQTDGHVSKARVPLLTPRHRATHTRELTTAGLWTETPDGYQIRNYAKYQKTRAHWAAEAERVQKWREDQADKKRKTA